MDVTFARPPTRYSLKITSRSFRYTHHLWNQLPHYFVNHVLICLFLIHLFSTIISPPECHHHHSYHPSPHHSSFPTLKLFSFSNSILRRHLSPLSTAFTNTWICLPFFSSLVFLVTVIVIYFPPFQFVSPCYWVLSVDIFHVTKIDTGSKFKMAAAAI